MSNVLNSQGNACGALRRVSAAVAALAASAVIAHADEPAAAADPRLGPEVDRICFGRDINGWKEIDGEDGVILLERSVNDWYRVELAGACPSRVFRFAEAIGIDSRPAGGCVTRGDIIIVRDTGNFTRRCPITRMNKWNEKAPPPAAEPEDVGGDRSIESADDR